MKKGAGSDKVNRKTLTLNSLNRITYSKHRLNNNYKTYEKIFSITVIYSSVLMYLIICFNFF